MKRRSRIPRSRTKLERKFNRWLGAWIIASTVLFIINLVNSPGFYWSLPFIILWTFIIGAYAIKTDRKKKQDSLGLLHEMDEINAPLPDLEYPEIKRNWKESDFV